MPLQMTLSCGRVLTYSMQMNRLAHQRAYCGCCHARSSTIRTRLCVGVDTTGNLNFKTNNALVQNFAVNNLNELTTETNGGTLTVAGTTTIPATSVTVNTSNAILYADSTFASTNQPWANGNNTYTAIGQDSYGRTSSNSVTVNLQVTNGYAYDLNGNLLSDTNRNFAYDDENQLIAVWSANSWSNSFVYDGKFRRRVEKDYAWESGAWVQTNETHFIYDGDVVIQERDANNNPQVTYTRSGSMLLARTDCGQEIPGSPTTAFYHLDANANVIMLIYVNQIVAAKYQYGPFGETLSLSGPLANVNVYRFASKEWLGNAGLYYFVRRYYDPSLQRFLNRDPIAEQGGINLYAYVANNPINIYDDLGLMPCWLQNLWNALFGPDDNTVGNLFPNYNPYDPNNLFDPNSSINLANSQNPLGLGTSQTGGNYQDTATTLNIAGIAQFGAEYGSGTAVVGLYTDAAASSGFYFNSTFWGGNQYVTTMRISELAHAAGPILFGATVVNDVYGAATHQESPLEAGRDIDAGFIGLVGGPPGAAIGITYSLFHQDINSTAAGGFQILTDWYYNAPLGPNFADQPGSP